MSLSQKEKHKILTDPQVHGQRVLFGYPLWAGDIGLGTRKYYNNNVCITA
jgi:carbamoylphosphate synthase small subunit